MLFSLISHRHDWLASVGTIKVSVKLTCISNEPWLESQGKMKVYIGRGLAGEQPCRKGSGDAGQQQAQQESAGCLGSKECKPHPGVHHQLLKLDSYPTLFSLTLTTGQFWASWFKNNVKVLEAIQRTASKLMSGLKYMRG